MIVKLKQTNLTKKNNFILNINVIFLPYLINFNSK